MSDANTDLMALAMQPLVQFVLNGQMFALPVGVVQEVQRPVLIHPVLGLPPELPGVIDRHGQAVAVLDLRRRLNLSGQIGDDSPDAAFLLVTSKAHSLVLPVDRVIGVAHVPRTALFEPGAGWDCVRGIIRVSGILLTLLDVDQLPFAALESLWSGIEATLPAP